MLKLVSDAKDAFPRLNELAQNGSLRVACAHQASTATPDDADVLVVSQTGDVADSSCMVLVRVADRGLFTRAERILLNGLSGFVGPAPNERLGLVDVQVTGGMVSEKDPSYTGGDFFVDLLNDREIALDCLSQEHTRHTATSHLSMMEYARITVFNMFIDPELATLGRESLFAGATIMLNGARGIVVGSGALGSPERPSVSCVADCFIMDKTLLLPKHGEMPARHTLAMAFPLWHNAPAKKLLAAAARLAKARPPKDAAALKESESRMAGKMASGQIHFVDPGPKPFRTI